MTSVHLMSGGTSVASTPSQVRVWKDRCLYLAFVVLTSSLVAQSKTFLPYNSTSRKIGVNIAFGTRKRAAVAVVPFEFSL